MNCSICFEDVTKATGCTTLSCDHSFHFRCISKWFLEQYLKDLAESCPCCRDKGTKLDRSCYKDMDDKEEEDDEEDEDYEEEEEEDDDDSTTESLSELARDIQSGLYRMIRQSSGEWVIQNNEEMAFDSFRTLFGPLNEMHEQEEVGRRSGISIYHWSIEAGTITRPASNREVRFIERQASSEATTGQVVQMIGRVGITREEAARKIQAFFRRNQIQNTHQAAMTLFHLFQQAYT